MVGAPRGSGRKKAAVLASKMVILTKQNGDISQTRRFNHQKLEVTYPMWKRWGFQQEKCGYNQYFCLLFSHQK